MLLTLDFPMTIPGKPTHEMDSDPKQLQASRKSR